MRRFFICLSLLPFARHDAAAQPVDYLRDIKPLLRERCYSCHGALKQKAGLRLDTATAIRRGSEDGPVVHGANAAESPLLVRVSSSDLDERMPPEGDALKPDEISRIRDWIAAGTPSPADEKPEPDPRDHWAFKTPVRPPLPATHGNSDMRNPIDAFIRAEQEKRGLVSAPAASKEVVLRRVYLDLIGMPPTREALHAFCADESPDAWMKVVETLLASREYAQRWARHWLDIWRYADWYGRRHVPDVWNSAPQVWRWRDWVVDSLHEDKGFDRMIVEMLAADEVAPEDDRARVATGYLVRNWYALNPNQWMRDIVEHTGKAFIGLTFNCAHCHDHKYDPISQRDYFRFRAFFEPLQLRQDRVAGEPDPGPFQKYEYSTLRKVVLPGMISVFDERLDAQTVMYMRGDERNIPENRPVIAPAMPAFLQGDGLRITRVELPAAAYYAGMKPFIQREETQKREQALATAVASLAAAEKEVGELRAQLGSCEKPDDLAARAPIVAKLLRAETIVRERIRQRGVAQADCDAIAARIAADKARYAPVPRDGHDDDDAAAADTAAIAASHAERALVSRKAETKLAQSENALLLLQTEQALAEARAAAAGAAPKPEEKAGAAAALKVAEDQVKTARDAAQTARAAVETAGAAYTPLTPSFPAQSSGRRRALAAWMTDAKNPLTARVAMNHIWARHFHAPLVASVFDFGRNGAAPTHPELLDWLAVEFMEHGWSMKHMHRLIVTTDAYRRISAAPATAPDERLRANESIDTANRFLWRMNPGQMEAEVLRDAILHLAGTLDLAAGGPPIPNAEAEKSKRRSLYFECFPEPGGQSQFSIPFDPPEPTECYRRMKTIVPQQALALSNSTLCAEQSAILAKRVSAMVAQHASDACDDNAEFIVAACEQILTRGPTQEELAACKRFLTKQCTTLPPDAARASLVRVLLNHNDFISIR